MKRANNLFIPLISDENLSRAIDEVDKSHHWCKNHQPNKCTLWVEITKEERIKELRQIIINGFKPNPPITTKRWDASAQKYRIINEPQQYPDQYIHHALIQVLQPVMMRGMDFYCCGSIKGRGIKKAKTAIESWVRKCSIDTKFELTADIHHFYDSVTSKHIMDRMRHLIKDRKILDLIEIIVSDGLKIGYYTSQWFANTLLQPLDMEIRQSGLCKHYCRYMDNLTIFGSSKRKLRRLFQLIVAWLKDRDLELKGDWQIFRLRDGRLPYAVGYRYGRTYTIPRKRTFFRLKRAISRYWRRKTHGKRIAIRVAQSILSRLGQLRHCNNYRLYEIIYARGKIVKDLKKVVRRRKELTTWNMYLEREKKKRFSRQKATNTQTILAFAR